MGAKRIIATVAVLGGFAVLPLLSGLSRAKADELSDLRANERLLQQRIDQLPQTTPGDGAGTAQAGAPPSAGGFPRSFLIPGTDTSVRVGGRISEKAIYGTR